MNIFLIGSGGREHAIAKKLYKSPSISKIWCAPGNGGTESFCENTGIGATDLEGILAFCRERRPDYTAVLSDDPLALGLVDLLEQNGFKALGPTQSAARLEWSKSWAKEFMAKYNIPTAAYKRFSAAESAEYAQSCPLPIVVKADGLALGKGVIICNERQEVIDAVQSLSAAKSGAVLIFEELLQGPEISQLCFTDGKCIIPMPAAQDHKRAFDGDIGPNTGGMGAYSPVPIYDEAMQRQCMDDIIMPTLKGLQAEGIRYCGILYFGLMLTKDGIKVIEYNARFGDPEAQTILPLLESDLFDIFTAIREGRLESAEVKWHEKASCCVIMASGGYPGAYAKGCEIKGLGSIRDAEVFHAGTRLENGVYYTNGGRVLAVTATSEDLPGAIEKAYRNVGKISFDNCFYRKDIGARAAVK